jgi:3-ketosteroid 9alpha-monooxygenase subunit B
MSYHKLQVSRIIQETPDARSFVLSVPAGFADRFSFQAGQFLTFMVPHPEGPVVRCYSLSSTPADGEVKVTVKRVAGGRGSNWFHDALKEGASIDVMPPSGRFVLAAGDAPLLFFAGGSGITPIMSLVRSALASGSRRIRLFYANRDEASIIFRQQFDQLAAEHPGRLEVIHHLDAVKGFAKPQDVAAAVAGFDDALAYLCGPAPFMAMTEEALVNGGMPRHRVLIERFEASANPAVPSEPLDLGEQAPAEIVIHLEGKVHRVPYTAGQSILEAARAAGLSPNSACEEGFCASCAAKTIKGKVVLANNEIYTKEDLASGWILTCQGRAFGAEVEITYDTV